MINPINPEGMTRTREVARLVFFPVAVVSAAFTAKLFWDFGDSFFSAAALAVVGLGMESLKLVFLARWSNAGFMGKKTRARRMNFAGYVSIAALCAFASLAFGLQSIERRSLVEAEGNAKAQEIKTRITDAEARLKAMNPDAERASLQAQIDALAAQIPNVTAGVAERSIEITRRIEQLERRKRELSTDDGGRGKTLSELTDLRTAYALALRDQSSVKGSFEILGAFLGLGEERIRVLFLFFVVVAMEVGIAVTSGTALSARRGKIKAEKKRKDAAQLTFGE